MALCTVDLSFQGEVLGRLKLPVPPPGGFGQEKGDGTRADFWIPSVLSSALPGTAPLALQR